MQRRGHRTIKCCLHPRAPDVNVGMDHLYDRVVTFFLKAVPCQHWNWGCGGGTATHIPATHRTGCTNFVPRCSLIHSAYRLNQAVFPALHIDLWQGCVCSLITVFSGHKSFPGNGVLKWPSALGFPLWTYKCWIYRLSEVFQVSETFSRLCAWEMASQC